MALLGSAAQAVSLASYAWRHSWPQQLWLLLLSLLILPLVYAILEIPKHIINHALHEMPFEPVLFIGFSLQQQPFLFALCAGFLLCICLQAGLKYSLNLSRGRLAEQQLFQLRHQLIDFQQRSNHDPLPLIPVVVRELEVIAGFISEIYVLPLFQGGVLLTSLGFVFVQSPMLGLAASVLLPLQMLLIPRLQRRVNRFNVERARKLRSLSEALGSGNWGADSALERLSGLQSIRLAMLRRKFLIKAVYSITYHLSPFAFYTLGGYLVLTGELTLGALIATLAAHRELGPPLKELFSYYQSWQDAKMRWGELQRLAPEALFDQQKLANIA